ncbi:MAG: hypothetical protein REI78_10195 [Pedobacter sp.]|nr:hypothetical protein [Pedobacter sp.]
MFQPEKRGQHFDLGAFHQFLLGSLIVVSFISDLIFRFAFKDLKKIWLVELVFIIFTVVLVLILKK